jgi:hypothetical protein
VVDAGVALASGVLTEATVALAEGLGAGVDADPVAVVGGAEGAAVVLPPLPQPATARAPIRTEPARLTRMWSLLVADKARGKIPRSAVIVATRCS